MKKIVLRIPGLSARVYLALLLCSTSAGASDFYFYFNNIFSAGGVSAPAGPAPWIDAHFQDVSPGTVRLTVDNLGLGSGEFVSQLYLNLNTADNPGSLVFNRVASSGAFTLPAIYHQTANAYKAGGDGYYDIEFAFSTANNTARRFNESDSVTYQITGIPGLVAADFIYGSAPGGGAGAWFAATHIQGICSGAGSVWASPLQITPVPEPAAGALLVLSAGLWRGRRSVARWCGIKGMPQRN
jgi:hypothetical protein